MIMLKKLKENFASETHSLDVIQLIIPLIYRICWKILDHLERSSDYVHVSDGVSASSSKTLSSETKTETWPFETETTPFQDRDPIFFYTKTSFFHHSVGSRGSLWPSLWYAITLNFIVQDM